MDLFIEYVEEVKVDAGIDEKQTSKILIRYDQGHGLPGLFEMWAGNDPCRSPSSKGPLQSRETVLPILTVDKESQRVGPLLSDVILRSPRVIADMATASGANLKLEETNGKIQMSKMVDHTLLCVPTGLVASKSLTSAITDYRTVVFVPTGVVDGPVKPYMPKTLKTCDAFSASPPNESTSYIYYVAHLRSVQKVFYFLGALIDNENHPEADSPEDQINLEENEDIINFHIRLVPSAKDAFSVSFEGSTYYVAQYDPDTDFTMPILAILNDLTNLHRDASEILKTPAVQTVP